MRRPYAPGAVLFGTLGALLSVGPHATDLLGLTAFPLELGLATAVAGTLLVLVALDYLWLGR